VLKDVKFPSVRVVDKCIDIPLDICYDVVIDQRMVRTPTNKIVCDGEP
jgi:hypothetical protein